MVAVDGVPWPLPCSRSGHHRVDHRSPLVTQEAPRGSGMGSQPALQPQWLTWKNLDVSGGAACSPYRSVAQRIKKWRLIDDGRALHPLTRALAFLTVANPA